MRETHTQFYTTTKRECVGWREIESTRVLLSTFSEAESDDPKMDMRFTYKAHTDIHCIHTAHTHTHIRTISHTYLLLMSRLKCVSTLRAKIKEKVRGKLERKREIIPVTEKVMEAE